MAATLTALTFLATAIGFAALVAAVLVLFTHMRRAASPTEWSSSPPNTRPPFSDSAGPSGPVIAVPHCSFCRKSQRQVKRLISAPPAYICDECVAICVEVLVEADGASTQGQPQP